MFFFFLCVGKRGSQAVRKAWREGRREVGAGGGMSGSGCSTTPVPLPLPPISAPFSKPPNTAIRQISLCHPWNAGDNYRLSTDRRPLSSHRQRVDPTLHIPTIEGEG